MVTWILQENALSPVLLDEMERAIALAGALAVRVRVVPFSHELNGAAPQIDGPCIAYGSSGLLALARRYGWQPAGWDGDAFGARATVAALGPHCLNAQAVLTRWSEVGEVVAHHGWQNVFLRPEAETKEFPGRVLSRAALETFLQGLARAEYFATSNSAAIVGPAQQIGREWRLFIVDNQIVDGCQYARAGAALQRPDVPQAVRTYAMKMCALYQPAPAYVMDICELDDGFKLVEFNAINSAGFYACDLSRIVSALTRYVTGARH